MCFVALMIEPTLGLAYLLANRIYPWPLQMRPNRHYNFRHCIASNIVKNRDRDQLNCSLYIKKLRLWIDL